ncbi:MAG: N,N-dimethylformamidase beta subunit family domain-containing protein [Chitinophagales bacterium]
MIRFLVWTGILTLALLFILAVKVYFVIQEYKKRSYPFNIKLSGVLAYTERMTFAEGESIPIYYNSDKKISCALYKLNSSLEEIGNITDQAACIQSPSFKPQGGFSWTTTYKLPTNNLISGYYYLKMTQIESPSEKFYLPILIKPNKAPKIAVIASTNTWMAYNGYGGVSCYGDSRSSIWLKVINYVVLPHYNDVNNQEYDIPFNRPFDFKDELANHNSSIELNEPHEVLGSHLIRGEWNLAGFLDKNNYEYGVYSDVDLAYDPELLKADLIIFNCHTEYWSDEMLANLRAYIERGGHVIFASGNNLYKRIKYINGGYTYAYELTPSEKAYALCGTFWNPAGFNSLAGIKVVDSSNWVFRNTDVKNGDVIGEEYGISGRETDKIGYESLGFKTLALGTNKYGPSYMVLKETEKGWVFNASSIRFTKGLQLDPRLDQMMRNLIDNAIQEK